MELARRVLYGFAALLLLAGLTLRIVPLVVGDATTNVPESDPTEASPVDTAGRLPQTVGTIVQGNVFSASRTPPRVRFTPPDLLPGESARTSGSRLSVPRLRLFGTVVSPSGTAALIDADPAVRGAEIYEVGDLVDGKRVVAVSESTVVLIGASGVGRTVLRLHPVPPSAR